MSGSWSSGRLRTFVNAGCGDPSTGRLPAHFQSWRQLRVDLDPGAQPDIVASVTDLSPIPDSSVDAVWTAHCLEHLYPHEVEVAVREFHRILRPDGFLCVLVPDLQTVAKVIAEDRLLDVLYESPAGPVTSQDMVFGFTPALARGNYFMAHRCGFTPTVLGNVLVNVGFAEVTVRRRPITIELAAVALKTAFPTQEQRAELLADLEL